MEVDRAGQFFIAEMDTAGTISKTHWLEELERSQSKCKTVEEEIYEELELVWDDASGAELNPAEVRKARAEEIVYVQKMKFYTQVLIEECYAKTGRAPISARWVDMCKGDRKKHNKYLTGFVARENDT